MYDRGEKMQIYVDADACPVKDTITEIAGDAQIPVTFVTSFSHYANAENAPGTKTVYVDTGAEAADYRIMKLAGKGDMIITQDYGLASLGLGKGCIVLHHKGFQYTLENIDHLLYTRHVSDMARETGKRTTGRGADTTEDGQEFVRLSQHLLDQGQ